MIKFVYAREHDFSKGKPVESFNIVGTDQTDIEYNLQAISFGIANYKLDWILVNNLQDKFWVSIVKKHAGYRRKSSLANFSLVPTIETATGQAMLARSDLVEMIDYDCKLITDDETAILFTLRFEQNDVKLRLYLS